MFHASIVAVQPRKIFVFGIAIVSVLAVFHLKAYNPSDKGVQSFRLSTWPLRTYPPIGLCPAEFAPNQTAFGRGPSFMVDSLNTFD